MATTNGDEASIDDELPCPVPGCSYSHPSANGIIGHVGNGHADGWSATDATPADIHKRASERDETAMRRVAKVEDYLARNGVDTANVDVYVHQAYGSVQIATDGYVEAWDAFRDAVQVDGIRYTGDVNYCTDEFVAQLPAFGDGGGS